VFYVQPFQFSPSTMVALEADGVPLLPPHPTMPPYTVSGNSRQSSEIKIQAERPRMPMDRYSSSLSTQSPVASNVRVPMTMAILSTTDTTDTTHNTTSPTPLRSVSLLKQQHSNVKRGPEHRSATHDKQYRLHTQRYHPPTTRPQHTTALHPHYMTTPSSQNQKQKNTISLKLHHRVQRLPSIPENCQLLLYNTTLTYNPLHTTIHHRQYRQRDPQNTQNNIILHTKKQQYSLKTIPSQLTHHHQPHPQLTTATSQTSSGQFDNYHHHPSSIGKHTQQLPVFTANVPPPTEPIPINPPPTVADPTISPQFHQPHCQQPPYITAWIPPAHAKQNATVSLTIEVA